MNYFSTSAILNAVTSLIVSLFILLNNPKAPKNRSFAYFGFFVFLWAFFYKFWITETDKNTALFYMRISIGLAAFIPATFFHFATNLIEEYKKYRRSVYLLYFLSFIIFLTSPFKLFIRDAKPLMMFPYWPLAGITYDFHALNYFVTPIFGFLIIYQKIKGSPPREAKQLNLVLWGIFFSYIGGGTNFPLNYSILFPPIGNIFVSLYTVYIAYAAFRYQLMNINIIIKKSLLYTLLITTITLVYFLSSYLIEHFFQSMFGYKSLLSSMVSATFIALAFIPLRNFIQNFIEKSLFKGSYMQIAEQNERLRQSEKTLAELYDQADKLSKTDALTEINNRRHFSEMLNKKMQDSESLKTSFYLVIFDVDHFKEINDTYGHTLGDMVLVKVVGVVKNNVRSNDFIGRFGGDEFVICLDFSNKEGILNRLTKIRDGVKALSFTHEGKEVSISVSIGAAKFMPGTGMTEKSLIERADAELFNVKKSTRGEISVNE